MPEGQSYVTLDDADRDCIRRKARQLVRRSCFRVWEPEDLEQALALCLLQRLRAFDPAKGPRGPFVVLVLTRCAANLVRDQQVRQRRHRRTRSLQAPVATGDGMPVLLSEVVGQRELDSRRGHWPRSPEK